jgi:hypothetical protein
MNHRRTEINVKMSVRLQTKLVRRDIMSAMTETQVESQPVETLPGAGISLLRPRLGRDPETTDESVLKSLYSQ